jgi:OmpR family response regulator RpaB
LEDNLKQSSQKILIVEDEASIRKILETYLSMVGYVVVTASNGEDALTKFYQEHPDLVVLDMMIPKLDGYGVCRILRKQSGVPIIMLTALADVADRIVGLEAGADDYVAKPFSAKELEARIRCLLRHPEQTTLSGSGVEALEFGSLKIDNRDQKVYRGGVFLQLTHVEFNLLKLFVSRPQECISRSEILEKVWGYLPQHFGDMRLVDVHVSHLQEKLQGSANELEFTFTAHGKGYMFRQAEY